MIPWILLSLFLPSVLAVHTVASRSCPSLRDVYRRHRAALGSVLAVMILFTAAAWAASPPADSFAVAVYMVLAMSALGHAYFLMFCNSETGRRYYLMNLLAAQPRTENELRALYDRDYIIRMRVERLLHWQMIQEESGRLRLIRKNSLLFSKLHRAWARLLRFEWPSSS
jgi:hypothetical protein